MIYITIIDYHLINLMLIIIFLVKGMVMNDGFMNLDVNTATRFMKRV